MNKQFAWIFGVVGFMATATHAEITKENIQLLQQEAEQGNVDAQYDLALRYKFGNGVAQDYHEAFDRLNFLANQGYIAAQYYLAVMYENGEGVPQDTQQALKWYGKAAIKGHYGAMAALMANKIKQDKKEVD